MKKLILFVVILMLVFPSVASAEPWCCVTLLSDVTAERVKGGMMIRWESVNEFNIIGYNVLMERHGKLVKLNSEFIQAEYPGSLYGSVYQYRVKGHKRASFWLEVVALDGSSELWKVSHKY